MIDSVKAPHLEKSLCADYIEGWTERHVQLRHGFSPLRISYDTETVDELLHPPGSDQQWVSLVLERCPS
jgi:hypothetical protein